MFETRVTAPKFHKKLLDLYHTFFEEYDLLIEYFM